MSKLVLLSDIHANARALESAIIYEGWDAEYVILGDIMGLNGFPQETLELVQSVDPLVVLGGNHDKAIFRHKEGHVNSEELSSYELEHTRSSLSNDGIEYMQNLPYLEDFEHGGTKIRAAHAEPNIGAASGYVAGNLGVPKSDIVKHAARLSDRFDWVFLGHTHEQYDVDCTKFGHGVHFVNPGSLGWSGEYATVDTSTGEVELKTVEWDENAVKERIADSLPDDAPSVNEWL